MLGFTQQEQKIVLFLVFSLVVGAGVQLYKRVVGQSQEQQLNAAFIEEFRERAAAVNSDSLASASSSLSSVNSPSPRQKPFSGRVREAEKATGRHRKVNINSSTSAELEALPRIGPTLAKRIVEYRNKHGEFSQVRDLIKVKGIGKSTLKELEPYVALK